MHIHRKTLYLGVFLVVAAGVMLAGQAGWLDVEQVARALELWPLAVIAIGGALILRRTRVGIASGMLAAAMPGLLLGGAAIAAPRLDFNCGTSDRATFETRNGTFEDGASVDLDLSCGRLEVGTGPGSSWEARTADGANLARTLDASAQRLAISSGDRTFRFGRPWDAEIWKIVIPTDVRIGRFNAQVNAGEARLDLGGARLGEVAFDVNAGDFRADLTGAIVERFAVEVNAGAATIHLPNGADSSGTFTVNAGGLSICVPDGLGVRIVESGELSSTSFPGFERTGGAWQTPNYATATIRADVTVTVNVGSVDIDPEGDCK